MNKYLSPVEIKHALQWIAYFLICLFFAFNAEFLLDQSIKYGIFSNHTTFSITAAGCSAIAVFLLAGTQKKISDQYSLPLLAALMAICIVPLSLLAMVAVFLLSLTTIIAPLLLGLIMIWTPFILYRSKNIFIIWASAFIVGISGLVVASSTASSINALINPDKNKEEISFEETFNRIEENIIKEEREAKERALLDNKKPSYDVMIGFQGKKIREGRMTIYIEDEEAAKQPTLTIIRERPSPDPEQFIYSWRPVDKFIVRSNDKEAETAEFFVELDMKNAISKDETIQIEARLQSDEVTNSYFLPIGTDFEEVGDRLYRFKETLNPGKNFSESRVLMYHVYNIYAYKR